jgi:hypothetical protein
MKAKNSYMEVTVKREVLIVEGFAGFGWCSSTTEENEGSGLNHTDAGRAGKWETISAKVFSGVPDPG